MMKMHVLAVMLIGVFGLIACETVTEADERAAIQRAKPKVPVAVASEAPDPGELGDYAIPKGKCGMVLWARAGTQTVPIFRALADGSGVMEIDGAITALARSEMNGESRATISQFQKFQTHSPDGTVVTVEANAFWGQSFPGGSYIDRGTLTLTGADGWSRVMPVAGIAGCKA